MGGFFLVHRDELARDGDLVAKLSGSYSRRVSEQQKKTSV